MRFALYGAGRMAPIHAAAIVGGQGQVVGLLDPNRTDPLVVDDRPVQAVADLDGLLDLDPDAILVATPTGDHARSIELIAGIAPGTRIIVEKPVATSAEDYRSAMDAADANACPVSVLLHAAHAPEVQWAQDLLTTWQDEHGLIRRSTSRFCDPYGAPADDARRASLVSSWIDSGINLLSVLDRFLDVTKTEPVDSIPPFEHLARGTARFSGTEPFPVTMITSWRAIEPSKSTVLDFEDGAQHILDHQAVAGWLLTPRGQATHYRLENAAPRLAEHYRRMFKEEAATDWRPHRDLDDRLHKLLFAGRG